MKSIHLASGAVDALLAEVRAAVPVLAAHAEATDEASRVSSESVEALRAAGVFALTTPREFGGWEADLVTTVQVLSELGRGCPSSAWVAAVSTEAKTHFSRLMPDDVKAEFYADPHVRLCTVGTPAGAVEVPGGARITGRWSYASGAEDAQWACVGVVLQSGDAPPRVAGALVPTSELDIERTWRTAGMRGTGSHTLVAADVFVPTARLLEIPAGANGAPDLTLGRPLSFVAGGIQLAAPLAGAARGALEAAGSLLSKRKPPMTAHESLAELPAARNLFAEAEYLVSSGCDRLLRLAERVQEQASEKSVSGTQRSAFRMELVAIVRQFIRAVDLLLDLSGSSGFALDSPVQRFWRDLNVGARHVQFTSYLTLENHGLEVTGAGEPLLPF